MMKDVSIGEGHAELIRPEARRTRRETVHSVIRDAGPKAVESYLGFLDRPRARHPGYICRCAANHFFCWCADNRLTLDALRTDHVNQFITAKLQVWQLSTANLYLASLKQLFSHLASHHIIEHSPFTEMIPPTALKPGAVPRNLDDLRALLYALDGIKEESNYFRPGLVALYPIVIGGMNLEEIAGTTQLPLSEVELYAGRLRKNGIWTSDEKVAVEFEDCDKEAGLAAMNLVLMIGCAAGDFAYVPANAEPDGSSLSSPSLDDSDLSPFQTHSR